MNESPIEVLKKLDYYDELMEILFKNRSGALASNFLAPIGLAYMFLDYIPTFYLSYFVLLEFILGFTRIYSAERGLVYLKQKDESKVKKYLSIYLASLFLTSIFYGVMAILTIYHAQELHIFIMLSIVFGLISGATSTLSAVYHAVVFYTIPFISLFILGLLFNYTDINIILAIVLTIYIVITLPSTFRLYITLKTNIEKTRIILKQKEQIVDNQTQIINSEKMASLGEMLANIAHQWRQPLSSISMIASGIKLENELDIKMTKKEIDNRMDTILLSSEYLSKTIDTFRNFLQNTKKVENIVIQDRLCTVYEIVGTVLKDAHIDLKVEYNVPQAIVKPMVSGELDQVIINIINNAKDILLEKNIQNPWIKIELSMNEENIVISIEDNAGGVQKDIITKIFDAYFTTKHKYKGTGLGLHMSYKIVNDSLNGKLYVKNTDNGAKFFIELPLNL